MQATTLRFDQGTPGRFIVVTGSNEAMEKLNAFFSEKKPLQLFQLFDTEEGKTVAMCFCDNEMTKSMAFALNTFHAKH